MRKAFFPSVRKTVTVAMLLLVLLLSIALVACNKGEKPCDEHVDDNKDGTCDVCGEAVTPPCDGHVDDNKDGACDRCGAAVERPACSAHYDLNSDNTCDTCGACLAHGDGDCNNACDRCGAAVEIGHTDQDKNGSCDQCRLCVVHVDATCDGTCDRCAASVAVVHIDVNTDGACDTCGATVPQQSFSAVKTASVPQGVTLYPAERISYRNVTLRGALVAYTVSVTNTGSSAATLLVTDTVPANTHFLSGCSNKVDKNLSWTVTVPAGETREISYTVTVGETATGRVSGVGAKVNGTPVDCYDLYIEQTLNEVDMKYIDKAIKVLSTSTFTAFDFAKHAYTVAFTNPKAITALFSGTPAEALDAVFAANGTLARVVVPGFYGGTAAADITDAKGARGAAVSATDLISGDLLLVQQNDKVALYVVCEKELYDITGKAEKADMSAVLAALGTADRYVAVRPSVSMTGFTPADPNEQPEVMNAYQEALVTTAETYLLRGESLQYEDVWFGLIKQSGEHRWAHGQKAPEEYTADEWGYVNCAVFTYDVYLNALGYTLPNNMYTTANLATYAESRGMREFYFENTNPGNYTAARKLEIERQFMATLQIGDLIVVRRNNNNGHVMLYIGNGKFIHSGGASYSKTSSGTGYEVYEPTIRYHKVADYIFGDNSTGGNPFRGSDELSDVYVKTLLIVRPLNSFSGSIPTNTVARIQNMQDIKAEKRSSHPSSTTVNPGDKITFTFTLFNVGNVSKTVDVYDKVPVGTTLVSGGESVSGDELRWKVTVNAGETKTVSYTVSVDNVADGTLIDGNDATVGGVKHRCAAIYVKKTLTAAQQQAIIDAVNTLKKNGSKLTKLSMVNEIYRRALNVENVFTITDPNNVMRDGDQSVFKASNISYSSKTLSCLNTKNTYYSRMLVDHLYGGMRFDSVNKPYDRTRLLKPHNLVVGDVLIARSSTAENVYIYLGDGKLVLLNSGVGATADFVQLSERIMYYARDFAVLRPSFVM